MSVLYPSIDPNRFIEKFRFSDSIETVFTCGCCFWFAYILCRRFINAELVYDQVEGHFGAKIDGRVYDITGDVTDGHEWEPLLNIQKEDPLLFRVILRDCILMEDNKT